MQQLLISSPECLFLLLEDLCDIEKDDNDAYSYRCWLIRTTLDQISTRARPPSISTSIPGDAAEATRAAGIRFVHNAFLRHDINEVMEERSSKALVDSLHTIHAFVRSGLHLDATLYLRLFFGDATAIREQLKSDEAVPRFGVIHTCFAMPPQVQPEDQSFELTICTDLATVVQIITHRNADLLVGLPEDLSLGPTNHGLHVSPAATAPVVSVGVAVVILAGPEADHLRWPVVVERTRPKLYVPSVAMRTNAEELGKIALGWMRSPCLQPQQEADMQEARRLISIILEESPQSTAWGYPDMGFDIASFPAVHWAQVWWKDDRRTRWGEERQYPVPEPSGFNAFISSLRARDRVWKLSLEQSIR